MAKMRSTRSAVVEVEEVGEEGRAEGTGEPLRETPASENAWVGSGAGDEFHDPLYPVALLKIAMAMKDLDSEATLVLDRLFDEVLDDMVIDRDEFRRYLQRNMGRLIAAVKLRGY